MGLLGLLLFGGGLAFADQEVHRFERLAASDIGARLTDLEGSVEVEIQPNGIGGAWGDIRKAVIRADQFSLEQLPLFTEPSRSRAGNLRLLELHLREFTLRKLKVAQLDAEIPDCRFDFGLARREGQMRLSQSGEGSGTVQIRQDDLARYLVRKFVEIKSARVVLANQQVFVEGDGEFLMIKTHFAVRSGLAIREGRKIELVNARVFFDWEPAESASVTALLKTLNPVIDLDKDLGLAGAVDIESLDVRSGRIVATGRTRIPEAPVEASLYATEDNLRWLPRLLPLPR